MAFDVDAVAGPADGDEEGEQDRCEQRSEQPGEHRSDVLDDALLGLDEPSGHDDPGRSAAWKEPLRDELLRNDPDGLERAGRERGEYTAAESHEDEVDEPFTGEADEIHASAGRSPAVGHVGQAHHEPQGDGQVDAGDDQRL